MTEIQTTGPETTGPIDSFLSEWTSAERAGDARKLEDLLTDDFYGVGPLGFVLPKEAWLARHRQGLTYETFDLEQIQIHLYPDVALVTAQNNTRGSYQGQPIPEAVRATLAIVKGSGNWRLAAIHMSFIAGAPGSPPLATPARTRRA
jgi:ketosteroid isomerase-like protein